MFPLSRVSLDKLHKGMRFAVKVQKADLQSAVKHFFSVMLRELRDASVNRACVKVIQSRHQRECRKARELTFSVSVFGCSNLRQKDEAVDIKTMTIFILLFNGEIFCI